MEFQRFVDWADERIVNSPGRVVVVFLLLTAVFTVGLTNVSTESGTQQFSEDLPAEQALQSINEEFGPTFATDTGSTQLIQRGENVLAKQHLLYMLEAQHRLEEREGLRVASTSSAASIIARTIDPTASTTEDAIDVIERAPPGRIRKAVRTAARTNPQFTGLLSNDFNRRDATASATIGVVTHRVPAGLSGGSGQGGSSPLTPIQLESQSVVDTVDGDIRVFGTGLISDEFGTVIGDSLLIVVPAAVILIVVFLVIAYRDLVDLLLGTFALGMAIVWTFGFLGLFGIPFNQIMISLPPLLLAVGIDFGIHSINRYREERSDGTDIETSMRLTTDQLLVAFFIVTGTTVIGFTANLVSSLVPIRDFGIVASIGIVFVFLIFGVFLPAAKVLIDRLREQYPIPTLSQRPLGSEGSALGRVLRGGVVIAERVPVGFLLAVLVLTAGAGYYATGIGTSFTQEDFLPPEESPEYLQQLPEPFAPNDYSVVGLLNFLDENFESSQSDTVTIYLEAPMESDYTLEAIHRATEDPPDSFVREDGRADSTSIVTVVLDHAQRDPEFRRLVRRNDRDGNGIPDDNLGEVYDYLLDSPAREETLNYLSEERRSARVVYSVKADASQDEITADARKMAEDHRLDATATGGIVVFQSVSNLILESAVQSLLLALGGTVVFLVFIYYVIEGQPTLGIANVVPVLATVALVAGSMRALGIAFNAFTATILAMTIGLGIDYSVHVTHRYIDERGQHDRSTALDRTVRGTGGALAGSMLTTVFGIGVLVLAVLEVIGQFGLLTALSIIYSFLTSLLVLPSALVVWDRLAFESSAGTASTPPGGGGGRPPDANRTSTDSPDRATPGGNRPTTQGSRRDAAGRDWEWVGDTETSEDRAHPRRNAGRDQPDTASGADDSEDGAPGGVESDGGTPIRGDEESDVDDASEFVWGPEGQSRRDAR